MFAPTLVPSSVLGRWSTGASVVFLAFIAVFAIAVAAGQRGGEKFFDNLWLTVPMLIAYFSAVGAFVLGTVAIISQGERSLTVIAATVIGLLVTAFGIAEVAFPH